MPKHHRRKRSRKIMLSAYSIIMILVIALGIASHLLPEAQFVDPVTKATSVIEETEPASDTAEILQVEALETTAEEITSNSQEIAESVSGESTTNNEVASDATANESSTSDEATADEVTTEEAAEEAKVIVDGSGVVGASLSQVLMAPILGFEDAVDVCIFLVVLGGFLAVVAKTKALETGIKVLVKKLKGKEYLLIVLLMFIFSLMGTTYGFLEESVGFYVLLAATMFAAGLDPLVGVSAILLGAGSGVLGSTINPFATGVALSAMRDAGIEYNQGTIILIGAVLWITTLAISAFFVIRYAKKVQRDKGSTFLTLREQAAAEKKYGKYLREADFVPVITGRQKATLVIFALSFVVMIVGFIPWEEFGVTFFSNITGWLTGASLGNWWFYEAALWFLIMSIVITIINRTGERGFIDTFVEGASEMMGVVLVVAVARGASVLMAQTYLDNYIVFNASNFLATLPELAFVPLNYILHIFLSILVPSSSGLATLSTPIITPVASALGYSTEVATMSIVASNGLVNLITPTCGAIMGGLALAKIEYTTWLKWALKVVATIFVANIIILCLFTLL